MKRCVAFCRLWSIKTCWNHFMYSPLLWFFTNIEMLVLHFLLYRRPCQDIWITWIVIQPKLHSCLQAAESVLFCQKKHPETSSPSSRMTLFVAFYIFRTRNSKSLSRSERIRMASLTFVEERNLFLFLYSFHFWQLMAYENLMPSQDEVEKF